MKKLQLQSKKRKRNALHDPSHPFDHGDSGNKLIGLNEDLGIKDGENPSDTSSEKKTYCHGDLGNKSKRRKQMPLKTLSHATPNTKRSGNDEILPGYSESNLILRDKEPLETSVDETSVSTADLGTPNKGVSVNELSITNEEALIMTDGNETPKNAREIPTENKICNIVSNRGRRNSRNQYMHLNEEPLTIECRKTQINTRDSRSVQKSHGNIKNIVHSNDGPLTINDKKTPVITEVSIKPPKSNARSGNKSLILNEEPLEIDDNDTVMNTRGSKRVQKSR